MHQGVYAYGYRSNTDKGRWMAAVLATEPGSVLSHHDAAALHELQAGHGGAVEVTVPHRRRPQRGIRIHVSRIRADERTMVDGIPVTTLARTVLDLAAENSRHRTERLLSQAEFRGMTAYALRRLLDRYPRRAGTKALRELLAGERAGRGVTRSEFEERFLRFLSEAGLPAPELNRRIQVRGRTLEVDCVWRDAGLIVELDGRAAHATRRAFETDRERDRLLRVAGWTVIRVTWRQLHERPRELEADLHALLGASRG